MGDPYKVDSYGIYYTPGFQPVGFQPGDTMGDHPTGVMNFD